MKNFVFFLLTAAAVSLQAQQLNNDNKYIDDEGRLYTGRLITTEKNGRREFTVKEGVIHGEVFYYYSSGKLLEAGTFDKGVKDGRWVRYTENGIISAVAFYAGGKRHGTWLVYDDKGNKRFEMHYENGQKTGTWSQWDENGQVTSTQDFSVIN